jgi:hypothetical protein
MGEMGSTDPGQLRRRRLIAVLVVIAAVAITWPVVAVYLLGLPRAYWLWVPFYFAFITLYWVLAWGSIAGHLEELSDRRDRLVKGTGCLFLALLVFVLICALVAVLFIN